MKTSHSTRSDRAKAQKAAQTASTATASSAARQAEALPVAATQAAALPESGLAEPCSAPSTSENEKCVSEAVETVRLRRPPINLRKSMLEMSAELDQLLEQNFPAISSFYLLDKVARLSTQSRQGVTLDALAESCALPPKVLGARLANRMGKEVASGHLDLDHSGGCARYQLTGRGRRLVNDAIQTRLQLWKVNPGMALSQICAISDLEDAREEASKTNVALAARERESHKQLAAAVSPRKEAQGRTPGPFWAGLVGRAAAGCSR